MTTPFGARKARARLLVGALVAASLVIPAGAAQADASGPGDVMAHPYLDASLYTGATSDTAAASCWEIKQLHPASPSGVYWLLTPSMNAPQQFWCDQETDGGGWVKVGAGRNAWETQAVGRGTPATLLQATPAANTQTTQLSSETVDGLLDGAPVTALTDGVRVRRAMDTAGTTWQEVRFRTTKAVGWYWSFGGQWPVSSYTIGSTTGTSGTTERFGSATSGGGFNYVDTRIGTTQQYTWSFSYGAAVTGLTSATSYLWSATDGLGSARPFSEVYIRPKIINPETTFDRIADTGTPEAEKEIVPDSLALANSWGVTGIGGAVDDEGDVEVQAMARIGSTMFVGGNFATVQQDEAGTGQVAQPFLAAFNADTGAYLSSFTPTLNEAVQSLTALPDGRLAVGGKFTEVNGTAVTGLVVLNASTGAVTPGWSTSLVNSVSPGLVKVLVLTTDDDYLYVGGTFTHTTGPNGTPSYARNAMRLNLSTFNPDTGWRPEFNGSVQDIEISEDGTKAYFAGFFSAMSGATATSAAVLLTSSPAQLDPVVFTPVWSSSSKTYQQGVDQVGSRVYYGGSEHNLFSFDTSTYQRLTTQINNPKGDVQVIVADSSSTFLWSGSHSNNYTYTGSTLWPSIGTAWSRADTIGWVGVSRLSDVSAVSTFSPTLRSRLGSGAWAVAEAPNGQMWVGGDFESGRSTGNVTRWTGGFVRFGMTDGAAPNSPTNFRVLSQTATTVTLAWNVSAGGVGSGGSYQVLRDDRTIATTTSNSITVPLGGANRFFVRATDATGNVSASTSVLVVPGGNLPPVASIAHTVTGLDVAFDASGSSDADGTVVEYYWSFGDGTTSTEANPAHTYDYGSTFVVSLVVVDDQGAWSRVEESLEIVQPAPTDAYGAAVFGDSPQSYWRLEETSGTVAHDSAAGPARGGIQSGVTLAQPDALIGASTLAATFDGVDDQVVAINQVTAPSVYSAEAWFKTTSTVGGKIIGFGSGATGVSSSYDRHVIMQNDGRLYFGTYTGVENRATTSTAFNDGRWHHVVATQSADGMRLYVDGVLAASNAQTAAQSYSGYWRIGGDRVWSGATSRYFAGSIDEAAVYGVALNAEQVSEHHALGMAQAYPEAAPSDDYASTVLTDSPSAYWRLGSDVEGILADDSTGYQLGQAAGVVTTTSAPAVFGGAGSAVFAGAGSVSERSQRTAPSQYGLELWFQTTSTSGGKLIGFGSAASGLSASYDRHVYMTDDGRVTFGVYVSGFYTITTPDPLNDGAWHHLVAQQGPGGMELYVDGVLVGTDSQTAAQSYSGYWRVGGDRVWTGATNAYFSGSIGEVAIYDAPLAASRVSAHHGTGAAVPNVAPTAVFTSSVTDLSVAFDAAGSADSDGTIVGYEWDFGDGQTGSGVAASHVYAAAGTYPVTLTVTDEDGATGQFGADVTVVAPNVAPTAAFTSTATNLSASFDASGSADSDGTIASYAWDFGDGETGSGVTPTHEYAAAGTYTVELTVTDDDGASASTSQQITVALANVAPTAVFTSSVTDLSVAFDAAGSADSDGTIVSYAWDFGDGQTGSGVAASHDYAAAGTYPVTLTVTDEDGATGQFGADVTVVAPNVAPTAAFTATTTNLSASFDASGSSDSDGTVASYAWDFGDFETGSGVTATHSYGAPGTYTVVLTVTDDDGASTSTSQQITVALANVAPTAVITSSQTDLTVQLNGTGSTDGDGSVVDYTWQFGDGNSASGPTATYTYAAAGTYTVVLVVTDDDGATGVATTVLTVTAPANLSPTAAFTSTATDLSASFDAGGSSDPDGSISGYAWDFGDGNAGSGETPTHEYAAAGTYTVILTVTDNGGATATASDTVTVTAPDTVEVTTTPVEMADTWSWYYETAAPPAAWKDLGFDASGWSTGGARLGWGSASIVTNIDHFATTTDRPRAAYFVKEFDVPDASRVVSLTLDTVADDGVVIYVNGVEVDRHNMRDGVVTHLTYAASARSTATADADPVVIAVPTDLLVDGTNVIAAETHLNFRATRDLSYRLEATLVTATTGTVNQAPSADISASVTGLEVSVDGSGSTDPDGTVQAYSWEFGDGATATGATATHTYATSGDYTVTLTVTDNRGGTDTATTTVSAVDPGDPVESTPIAMDATWSWYYETAAPPATWKDLGFDASGWETGGARLGWGSPLIVTNIDDFATTTDRPRTAYWVKEIDIPDASQVVSLTLDTVANDGVVVYVNGVEVDRHNMRDGVVTHLTYAPSARNITVAENDPVIINVPLGLLVDGTNVITAETHLNYRATPDLSFHLEATMLAH